MSNPDSMYSLATYAADMHQRGIYSANLTPWEYCKNLWQNLKLSGATMRGDKRSVYPWYAAMHHMTQSTTNQAYKARAWSFGVYTRETFNEHSLNGQIDAELNGALVVTHAIASQDSFIESAGGSVFTLPFVRFAETQIPLHGTWVLVVYDVDRIDATPELVYHEYSVEDGDLRSISASSEVLLPLSTVTANHYHQLESAMMTTPRILMRVKRSTNSETLCLLGASVEINLISSDFKQFFKNPIGDTVHSMRLSNDPTTVNRTNIHNMVLQLAEKHRVTGLSGFHTTNPGVTTIIGDARNAVTLDSAAFVFAAIHLLIREIIEQNADEIYKVLTKLNPKASFAGDTDRVALMEARHGMEALFAVVSPKRTKSRVLAELKRIFGKDGLPSIYDFLHASSGLPDFAPVYGDFAKRFQTLLEVKTETSNDSTFISDDYLAATLSMIPGPVWSANKSPLALDVIISIIPDFLSRLDSILKKQLHMPTAKVHHSREQENSPPTWKNRSSPSIYITATLGDYETAARGLLKLDTDIIRPMYIEKEHAVLNLLKSQQTPVEARDLQFVAPSPAATSFFVQSDAIQSETLDEKFKFNPSKMHEVVVFRDTTHDGESMLILLHKASKQLMVLKFSIAQDHRELFLRGLVGAIVSQTQSNYETGKIVAAELERIAHDTAALNLRKSYQAVSTATDELTRQLQQLKKFSNRAFVPLTNPLDSGTVYIRSIEDDSVFVQIASIGGSLVSYSFDIDRDNNRIVFEAFELKADIIKQKLGDTVYEFAAITIGPHFYIESDFLTTATAAQNMSVTSVNAQVGNDLPDPYGVQARTKIFNPNHINSLGLRANLIQSNSTLVQNHVGSKGTCGMITTHNALSDPSLVYSSLGIGRDSWYSPF